jgi:16S rRNA (cytosine967-C5)-methyltransferase
MTPQPSRSGHFTPGRGEAPSPARAVAAHVLERVARDAAFADIALEAALAQLSLPARDCALATELVFGSLRWQRYLDWILAPHSRRPLESLDPRVLAVLRMSIYQIVFLTRVPRFASVSDAVSLARASSRPGVAGFVNAVLRSFARLGGAEREPAAPRDPLEALATRCSFPTWLAARWVERYGAEQATALMLAMNERPPLTLRTNILRGTRARLIERLAAEERSVATPTRFAPEGLTVEHGGSPPASWRAFVDGAFTIQDEASMLIARLLGAAPGDTVGDACAAPGTKTTHLAEFMGNRGRVLALDPRPARLARVRAASARLGVTIVETRTGAVERLAPELAGFCDAVLVDVPCSNLGVLRRNPEVKWRLTAADVSASARRQREILAAAAGMVKRGGRLVYATCSLEPEENDAVAHGFLAGRTDFRLDPPAEFPLPLDERGVLRCLPHRHGTDGFTAVRFRRDT